MKQTNTKSKSASATKRTSSKSVSTSRISSGPAGGTKKKTASEKDIDHKKLDDTIKQLKDLGDKMGKTADRGFHETAEATRDQLRSLKEKLSDAADKGIHAVKDVAERIHLFASEATELTKCKIELYNLQKEKEKLFILMGEQLRNMYKSDNLRNIKNKLKYDFQKIDEIESDIAGKEKDISRLGSSLKEIR